MSKTSMTFNKQELYILYLYIQLNHVLQDLTVYPIVKTLLAMWLNAFIPIHTTFKTESVRLLSPFLIKFDCNTYSNTVM